MKDWPLHKVLCKETPTYKAKQEVVAAKTKLTEQEAALGVDHPETLAIVSEIGVLLLKQGKLKEAEPFVCRALEGWERTLGRDHRNTLTAVGNMGGLLHRQGKLSLAEPSRALLSSFSRGT